MPAISVLKTDEPQRINSGLGIVGDMPSPLPAGEVMDKLKAALQTDSGALQAIGKKIRRLGYVAALQGFRGIGAEKRCGTFYHGRNQTQ